MAASWKKLLTLVVTNLLLTTIILSHNVIDAEQKAATVDETELDEDAGTDVGVPPQAEDAKAAAEQVPGDIQVTTNPEEIDETEIGSDDGDSLPSASATETEGSEVEAKDEKGVELPSQTSGDEKTEVKEEEMASSSKSQPSEAANVDELQREGSATQPPLATRLDLKEQEDLHSGTQSESKSLGEKRQDLKQAKEAAAGGATLDADPTEVPDDESNAVSAEIVSADQSEEEQIEATSIGREPKDSETTEASEQQEKDVEAIERQTEANKMEDTFVENRVVDEGTEGEHDDSQEYKDQVDPSVSGEPKLKEEGEKLVEVQLDEKQQKSDGSQLKEREGTIFESQLEEDVRKESKILEKTEVGVETMEAGSVEDAEAKEKPRRGIVEMETEGVHGDTVSETLNALNEGTTVQASPSSETREELKLAAEDAMKDVSDDQAKPLRHEVTGASEDASEQEDERAEQRLESPGGMLADSEESEMDHEEEQDADTDLKFTDKVSAQDDLMSDIRGHDQGPGERSGFIRQSGSGPALRSLLSEKLHTAEVDRTTLEEQRSQEQKVMQDEVLEHPSTGGDQEELESPYGEEREHDKDKSSSEDTPVDDRSLISRFLTLRPYVVISERLLSFLDPWLEEIVKILPPELQQLFLRAPFALTPSRALLLFVASCVSLVIVSSCALSQSCSQKARRFEMRTVLEQLSTVQGALLISEKEKETVLKELESLKEELQAFENRSSLSSDEASQLSSQVQSLTLERDALQQRVAQQLDQISDLSATVSSQLQSINTATENGKSVQKKLDDTSAHASMLESQLYELQTTLQQSQSSALEMQSQLQSMTEEIAILQTSKEQLLLEAEGWSEKVQEQVDQISQLLDEKKTHQEAISLKDKEIDVLRECYQQLRLFESGLESTNATNEEGDGEEEDEEEKKKRLKDEVQQKIKSMIDVAQVNAKLNATEEEKNSLKRALSMEMESRMEMEDQVKRMKTEMEKLMESRQEAEKQATTTALKLEILNNYFKEKEVELNRKLGEQEARERASADQLVNTDEKTKEFEKMVHLYKEQVEDLQKEIQNIEADYRKQIALQEKKAHENWLVARQSEREVKEYKVEAQMLRHKILDMQNKLDVMTADTKSAQETAQAAPGIGLVNGMPPMLPGEERPMSRPLLQPSFGPPLPPFIPGPFLPHERPLPTSLFGPPMPPPPRPPMMFDRRAPDMRSPPPFDTWQPPPHMRRSPMPPRDRSPPRNRSPSPSLRGPSPPLQRGRKSPTSFRGSRYSPPRGRSPPPPMMGDRQSPRFSGSRVPPPRPSYNQRPGPRAPLPLQRSDFHASGQRSSTPDC